jgi:CBS domain containing-hemolysin-like protein
MIWLLLGLGASSLASLYLSVLTYALRDFSRARLEDALSRYKRADWLEEITENQVDLIFVTAVGRLLANLAMILLPVILFDRSMRSPWLPYVAGGALAGMLGLVFSVALPTAVAQYMGEEAIALSVHLLKGLRVAGWPLRRGMALVDSLVKGMVGSRAEPEPEQVEKDILSAVEEGEKEGAVDEQERAMIESIIELRDIQVDQAMTSRPEIVAIEAHASLAEVKQVFEESGHSRLPVYEGTLDQIVGILYARDVLKHLGEPPEMFDLRAGMRPPIYVPETRPLRDMLREFKLQKVHIAIVLDEYGGTAGLVTIEDILEELVGEISDEHEPGEPPMFRRISDTTFEADGRLYMDEVNRQCGLSLPEDQGFDTLGGYISTTLGRIPQKGTTFEQAGARFTVLDAEPQRIKRLRIDLLPQTFRERGR